jgi:ATP-dependent DNA ligase
MRHLVGQTIELDRRQILRSVLKFASSRVLEEIIGKRKDSFYEPGKRTGAWIKYRVNRGQELVIGGFLPGAHGLDFIIVGY